MTCSPQPRPAVFTPEAVASINRAYAEALDLLGQRRRDEALRVRLAEHMMLLARGGETDERRLCRLSIARSLGLDGAAA